MPTGKRWLIKAVCVFNASGATRTINLNITPVGGAAATLFAFSAANNTGTWQPVYIVAEAGEVVAVATAVNGPIVQVAGIQFDA